MDLDTNENQAPRLFMDAETGHGSYRFVLRRKSLGLYIERIDTISHILEFPRSFEGLPIVGVSFSDSLEINSQVKKMILGSHIKEFLISDFSYPSLEEIVIEEGSPFSLQGNRLYSENGTLLNVFPGLRPLSSPKDETIDADPSALVIQGDTLLNLLSPMDTLCLPPQVTHIWDYAFFYHCPKKIIASNLPRAQEGVLFLNQEHVRQLVITDYQAKLPPLLLRAWEGLEGLFLPEGNIDFLEQDGILYSKDKNTLFYLPPLHPQVVGGSYQVPQGILHLDERLFSRIPSLKRVTLPDSVQTLGSGLFFGNGSLEQVWMSDSITHFPNAWEGRCVSYQEEREIEGLCQEEREQEGFCQEERGKEGPCQEEAKTRTKAPSFLVPFNPSFTPKESGIFGECISLFLVHLPKALKSLEAYSFYHCSLRSLSLPEGLETIGEGAFQHTQIETMTLPRSVKHVGEDAFGPSSILLRAYEGTAKGLLASLSSANVHRPARVEILSQSGESIETIPLPKGSSPEIKRLLCMAWDGTHFGFSAYAKCIPLLPAYDLQNEMYYLSLLHLGPKQAQDYKGFCSMAPLRFGKMLIQENRENTFALYLKVLSPDKGQREELLKLCNQLGRTKMIALLLEKGKAGSHGKKATKRRGKKP